MRHLETALNPDEELVTGASLSRVTSGGYLGDPFACTYGCAHLVTLRRFDSKHQPMGQNGPLIPCERRLAKMEIWEFQEVTSRGRFVK